MKFEQLGISNELLQAIQKQGFEEPTQIQEQSIPLILKGKDVIGESATGSGKTLAFGCGVIEHVVPKAGLQAIVLAPTRELAQQVKDSLKKFNLKHLNIMTVFGGVSIDPQIRDLRKADVVVATPGRVLDHMERGTIDLSKIKILVLDEADRMLDMGFIEDVEKIMRACPTKRQTLFFSATIEGAIRELAQKYMHHPTKVSATIMVDPTKLKQIYYDVSKNMKLSLLVHLLKNEQSGLVMVFCNTRQNTDFVVKNLKANKIDAIAIHGGLSQNKRTKTLDSFNDAKVHVLVCTDVAARGLHINSVSHVYNYDLPNDPKEYVHRIGRTARAGEEGIVINILSDFDHQNFSRIMQEYRDYNIERVDKPHVERIMAVRTDAGRARGGFRRGSPRGSHGAPRGQGFGGRGKGPRRGGHGRSRGPRRD